MLVDDHELIREGIKIQLAATDDLVVVGEAATARAALEEAERCRPDVVVMDVQLAGGGSGIEATRDIVSRLPETKVLMLTGFVDDQALFASIMAGASGYVLKQIRSDELLRAIRTVGQGGSLLDPILANDVLKRIRQSAAAFKDEKLSRLSAQEERILALVAEGKTNKEIAAELYLAEKTVKNYVSAILTKLGVTRRSEAAAYLARRENRYD